MLFSYQSLLASSGMHVHISAISTMENGFRDRQTVFVFAGWISLLFTVAGFSSLDIIL